jgi:Na+-translocating ferredoxin:NAD+ oxidoreductase RnfC subunit
MDKQSFINLVRDAGVVGEGGAGFPAHVKYDAQVETVIANGCECEPLLYSDQVIMALNAPQIVEALEAVMRAVGAGRGVIAFKRKYHEVDEAFKKAVQGTGIELARLDNFYPAGDEHILVHEVTGRTIPPLGLPKEVGAVVANVGTLLGVSRALEHKPVTHKVVTVTGEVAKPQVIRVPIGTSVEYCLEICGGAVAADPVYVMGGPMMGALIDDPGVLSGSVITKTSGGIIVLPRGHHIHNMATLSVETMQKRAAAACIQCRYCTDLCPRYLVGHSFETHKVMRAFGGGQDTAMGAMQALLCCECGVCEMFACPMQLSPRRINAELKKQFSGKQIRYEGPKEVRPEQSALRSFRKLPVPRLALRLDIDKYMDLHPKFSGDHTPGKVSIPLSQHIGAPAKALVQKGDMVNQGDCIGEIPPDALGARVHASISGEVIEAGAQIVIQGN